MAVAPNAPQTPRCHRALCWQPAPRRYYGVAPVLWDMPTLVTRSPGLVRERSLRTPRRVQYVLPSNNQAELLLPCGHLELRAPPGYRVGNAPLHTAADPRVHQTGR